MTKRLTLIRHAKSRWDDLELSDFDRPLSPRGIKAAPKIAKYLSDEGLSPDLIFCSPARRTKETLSRMKTVIPLSSEIVFDRSIYSAGMGEGIMNLLMTQNPEEEHVWVIGHNPAMQELSLVLPNWDASQQETRNRILRKFSTAAVCRMEFDTQNWQEIGFSKAKFSHFMTPKMLEKISA